MPIIYSKEEQGWRIVDPTPEELEQIQEIGTREFVRNLSFMAMEQMMRTKHAEKEAEKETIN
jgi:hypothetical protein